MAFPMCGKTKAKKILKKHCILAFNTRDNDYFTPFNQQWIIDAMQEYADKCVKEHVQYPINHSMRMFILTIEIHSDEWDYKKGQIIRVPVISNNWNNAYEKLDGVFWGGEYPSYSVIKIEKCDTFLFNPFKLKPFSITP